MSEGRPAKIIKISKRKRELSNSTRKLTGSRTLSNVHYSTETPTKIKISKHKAGQNIKKKNTASFAFLNGNDDSESNSGSEDDGVSPESLESQEIDTSEQLKKLFSTVTLENINFLRQLLVLMEKIYEEQQQQQIKQEAIISEPDPEQILDENRVNMHSSLSEFLPPMTIAAIFHRHQDPQKWKKLVTDILVEIYGKQLAYLSAKGSRGTQGIDPHIYRTIYDLINTRLRSIVAAKDFVRHINKVCSNRKKYSRKKDEVDLNTVATTSTENDPLGPEQIYDDEKYSVSLQYTDESYCPLAISETFSQVPT